MRLYGSAWFGLATWLADGVRPHAFGRWQHAYACSGSMEPHRPQLMVWLAGWPHVLAPACDIWLGVAPVAFRSAGPNGRGGVRAPERFAWRRGRGSM